MSQKSFAIPKDKIKQLIPDMGGCIATDRITVDGKKIGYMYRESPNYENDSGWVFMAGDETDDYMNNPQNAGVYEVNTITNYDPTVIPYLKTAAPCAFQKRRWLPGYKSVAPPG
jgi:hypothetical protein